MSLDFALAWPCPHLTVEEVVPLGADRRSLDCRQPVGASNTVRILVNDEFFIPQGGLYTQARLFGATSGPFDLAEDEDTLTVETSLGTASVSMGVLSNTRLTTSQVLQKFKTANFTMAHVAESNGHLVFTDVSAVGTSSFVKVSGSGAASFGFGVVNGDSHQRGATGKQLFPSWSLHTRQDEITNRFPRFDAPIKTNPMFKVTYAVVPQRCLRCGGTYIENDLRVDEAGQSILIENEDLLYQQCLKILLTDRGSNPYHTEYGTSIRSRIGAKAVSGVQAILSEDVHKALAKIQTLQEGQAEYQQVTFKERLYAILGVQVSPHLQDPTTYLIEVTVQNAASEPINLSIVFTVPEVVALMGTNGLMLGRQTSGQLTSGS